MIPSNDNRGNRQTITVESGDGDFAGLYLTCLMAAGSSEPILAEIFATKDEAYDFARDLMRANPRASFTDLTGGGAA